MAADLGNASAALSLLIDSDQARQDLKQLVADLNALKKATLSLKETGDKGGLLEKSAKATVNEANQVKASYAELTQAQKTSLTEQRVNLEKNLKATEQAVSESNQKKLLQQQQYQLALEKGHAGDQRKFLGILQAAHEEEARRERTKQATIQRMGRAHSAAILENARRDAAEQIRLQKQVETSAIQSSRNQSRVLIEQAKLRQAANQSLMGPTGIGNRLITGTTSKDISEIGMLNAAYREQERTAAALKNRIDGNTTAFKKNSQASAELHAALRGLSGSMGALWVTYGSIAPLVAFAAIGAGMRQTYEIGKELEYQLKFVQVVAESSAINTTQFFDAVSQSMSSAVEASKGLRQLAQSGLSAQDALAVLPATLNLATIGEVSVKEAAEAATGAQNAFNLSLLDFDRIADVYAKAGAISNTSVSGIMESMKMASTVADFYKISIEETSASLAIMAKANIVGTSAGTAFRNAMKELYTPTKKATEALDQLKIKVYDTEGKMKDYASLLSELKEKTSQMSEQSRLVFLNDVFGERGAKAINQLLSNYTGYQQALDEIKNSTGFVNQAVAELQDTVEGSSIRMRNALQESLVKAFDESKESAREALDTIAEAFASEEFKNSVVTVAKAVAELTVAVVQSGDVAITLLEIYLGARGLMVLVAGFTKVTMAVKAAYEMQKLATAAAAALSVTNGALSVSSAAAATSMRVLSVAARGFLASLGPIGLALAAGTIAYQVWANAQDRASESTDNSTNKIDRAIKSLEKENARLQESINLKRIKMGLDKAPEEQTTLSGLHEAVAAEQRSRKMMDQTKDQMSHATYVQKHKEAQDRLNKIISEVNVNATRQQGVRNLDDQNRLSLRAEALLDLATNGTPQAQKFIKAVEELRNKVKKGDGNWEALGKEAAELDKKINAAQNNTYKPVGSDSDNSARSQANRIDRAALDGIKKAWDAKLRAEETGFRQYKVLLDQRVRYGSMSQEAANALLEVQEDKSNQIQASIMESQLKELESFQKNAQNMDEARITELETLRAQLSEKLEVLKNSHAFELQLRKQKYEEINKQNERELQQDIDAGKVKSQQNLEDSTREFGNRFSLDRVGLAGEAAYFKEIRENASQLATYKAKLVEAQRALDDLQGSQDVTAEVLRRQSEAVDNASSAYERLKESQIEAAEAARELAEEQQKVRESVGEGVRSAVKDYVESVGTAADQSKRLMTTSMKSMEDSIVQMVKTGKFSFKDFANTVIDELIRIEAQKAAAGMAGFLGKVFGSVFGAGTGIDSAGGSYDLLPDFVAASAKGNVFDGVDRFAKGGTFTNQLVTQPTLFQYAKGGGFGLGEMGEAGAEAVMPLTRDSSGNLGVRAQGGGGTQVVNNLTVNVQKGKDAEETSDLVSIKVMNMMKGIANQQIQENMRLGGRLNPVGS